MPPETTQVKRRVHIVGAGPVGLMLTALLQTAGTFSIRLYEKRSEYTRARMVKLDSYLVADSVENYCIDPIDGENVEAINSCGPKGASSQLDVGILPTQRHRTVA